MKKIRKIGLLVCVLACVFALAACGKDEKETEKKAPFQYDLTKLVSILTSNTEQAAEWDNDTIKFVIEGYEEEENQELAEAMTDGLEQFLEARKESGDYIGFYLDESGNAKYSVSEDEETVTIKAKAQFEKRDVKIAFTFALDDGEIVIDKMVFEPQYSLGETMKEAALNTVIGICTVICVLIFLSIIIAQFKHVAKLESMFDRSKKTKQTAEQKEETAVIEQRNTAASSVDETDDTELAAVIAATIAASRGTVSIDGFVVRSIKRASVRKW